MENFSPSSVALVTTSFNGFFLQAGGVRGGGAGEGGHPQLQRFLPAGTGGEGRGVTTRFSINGRFLQAQGGGGVGRGRRVTTRFNA